MHTSKSSRGGNSPCELDTALKTVFDTIPDPAFIIDRKGTVFYANKAFAILYGKQETGCVNENIYAIMPPELSRERKIKFDTVFDTSKRTLFEDLQNNRIYSHTIHPVAETDKKITKIYVRSHDVSEHKLVEKEAENRQIFNDAVIGAIPGAFYLLDSQGKYVQWNAYQRDVVVGISDAEMKNFSAITTIHPDDRQMVAARMADIMNNGIEDSEEVRVLIRGGSDFRWFRISGKRIIIDGIPFLIGIGIDIHERKIAEEKALKNSEDRFRILFEEHSAVKLIIEPDIGRIIDANKAAVKYYGWPAEKLREMTIFDINTLPVRKVREMMGQTRNSELQRFTFRHRIADGSVRDVDVFSSNIHIEGKDLLYSIVHDVSDSKHAEKQLRKLSTAIEQSPVTVIITDLSGNIEYVNPAFTKHTGYEKNDVLGCNEKILHSGLMPKEINEEIWQTILSGGVWHGELYNRKKSGELYWEEAVISPIVNEKGVISNFVSVKEDITEKKKLWTELIASKEKAEESDRLKTAFLANISHEIRTPMNGILGFAELLKEPELTGEEQAEFLELILQSGERMLSLINDLIDISRIEAGETFIQISETPVNSLLRDLHAFFKPQAEKKGLSLECSNALSDSESIIDTDRKKILQILTNLIQNALKFTHKGTIAFGYEKTGDTLEFFVSDTGIGIPKAMQEKIFDRFRQLDNSLTRNHEGSGLGLCISKAYIEMLGGAITLESKEGIGSTFRFTIPCKYRSVQNAPQSSHTVEEKNTLKPSSGMTIVIAEDDETSRLLLVTNLTNERIRVLTARNGLEAVDLVERHPDVDFVFMDIRMPEMNGLDATRKIKSIRPGLPVVAQTAFASEDERNKAQLAGCDGFLTKPVMKQDMLDIMKKLLGRK
ncbi:MAG: PAS domain S-box protein [Chlorobiaceae bacterium]|nr:PAS domain S-box protein [Chlorobiaceae bacterium]